MPSLNAIVDDDAPVPAPFARSRPTLAATGEFRPAALAVRNAYWLTFRVDAARRDALLAAIRALAVEGSLWDETGAFLMFESDFPIDALRDAVAEAIDPETDMALIGMPYVMRWELIGRAPDPALFRSLRHLGTF